MARRPEVTFSYNFERIKKQLNVYERSQAKFAGKKALTRLNRELKGKNGLVAKTYKTGTLSGGKFRDPVTFTLASTFGKQTGLDLTVGVKDEKAMGDRKGNPASKYLYPVIGGGSTKAYDTTFTQYLRNKDFIKNSEYPFAFLKSRYIRKTKRKRVSKNTYRNTVIALENQKEHGSIGGKLQDARVVAFKEPPKGSKWKNGGIYREVPMRAKNKKTGAKKFKFEPLFIFKKTPRQAGKVTFSQRIKKIADKRVFKYWVSETRKLAKDNRFYDQ
tara:strand:- start:279 stop:1097 length:819 start_codon:yes stop_codon:yes gene_type:complete